MNCETILTNSFLRLVAEWLLSGGDAGIVGNSPGLTELRAILGILFPSNDWNPKDTGPDDLNGRINLFFNYQHHEFNYLVSIFLELYSN